MTVYAIFHLFTHSVECVTTMFTAMKEWFQWLTFQTYRFVVSNRFYVYLCTHKTRTDIYFVSMLRASMCRHPSLCVCVTGFAYLPCFKLLMFVCVCVYTLTNQILCVSQFPSGPNIFAPNQFLIIRCCLYFFVRNVNIHYQTHFMCMDRKFCLAFDLGREREKKGTTDTHAHTPVNNKR